MLQLLGGPELLRTHTQASDFIRQIYRTIRLGILYSSIGRQKSHFFSQDQWKGQPLSESNKSPTDHLIDNLISLPGYLEQWQRLSTNPRDGKSRSCLDAEARALLKQADNWRRRNQDILLPLPESFCEPESTLGVSSTLESPLNEDYEHLSKYFLTAMLLSGYVALFALLCFLELGEDDEAVRYHRLACYHADKVLRLRSATSPLTASPNWVFPVKIVSLLGPELMQREMAAKMLEDLGRRTGLGKLGSIF
jgi:hypothetical protein